MSARERLEKSMVRTQEYPRAVCTGNFAIWQDFLLQRNNFFWNTLYLLDVLLRSFSQIAIVNNPISGLFIAISVGVSEPGVLISSLCAGLLGLSVSLLIRDSSNDVANGLTVYNSLLIGAVSYVLIPMYYGPFDAFSILMTILTTIFCVYLRRVLSTNEFLCFTWPFNLAEFILLFVLYNEDNRLGTITSTLQPIIEKDNATSDATAGDVSFIGANTTGVHIDWGMIFHGVIVSASQVLAVESVVTGATVYLAVLLFSPTTASFAFLGALIGSLAGLILGVEINEVYAGLWGYNTFLSGAALGGNFLVINGQTAAATIAAIIFTVIVHYSALFLFRNLKIPVLSLPFVLITSVFSALRNNPEDTTFSRPPSMSYPEKQRQDYIAIQRKLVHQTDEPEESEEGAKHKKDSLICDV